MPKGTPIVYRGWYSKEDAVQYCKERNEHIQKYSVTEKQLRRKCHYKQNPLFKKNHGVYPWLTWETD